MQDSIKYPGLDHSMTLGGVWIKTPSGYARLRDYVDPKLGRHKRKLEAMSAANPRQGKLFSS